jgi:carbamoyltransferase
LEEAVSAWFEETDAVPFMTQIFQIREAKRSQIPAVTHVDGSGRLQTASEHSNPLYHRLIATFAESTGVPMILNTSFPAMREHLTKRCASIMKAIASR